MAKINKTLQVTGMYKDGGLQQGLRRLAFESNKAEAQAKAQAKAHEAATNSAAGQARALKALKKDIDPLAASTAKFTKGIQTLHSNMGALSFAEHDRIFGQLNQKYPVAINNLDNMNSSLRASRFAAGNLAAQFNDIGVMMASGQSPFILAIQQGTQVSQVLEMMTVKGSRLKTLKAAFSSFISPVSLLTVGLIAGGAALGQWAMNAISAAGGTSDLTDRLEAAREETERLNEELRELNTGMSSAENTFIDNLTQATIKLREEQELLKQVENELEGAGVAEQRVAAAQAAVDAAAEELQNYRDVKSEILQTKREQEARKEVAEAQGALLEEEIRLMNDAALWAERIKEETEAAEAAAARKLTTMAGLYAAYADTRKEGEALAKAALEAYRSGKDLSTVDVGAGVDAAAIAAAELARQLGISLANAQGMVALGAGLAAPSGPDQARANVQDTYFGKSGLRQEDIVDQFTLSARPSRKGGGRGKSEAEKIREQTQSRLEALQERFMTEAQLQQEQYMKDQETLKSALEQKFLTEEEYRKMSEEAQKRHNEKMVSIDAYRYGTTLDKTSAFLGDMADAFASGNEEMLEISKVFGAAQALISAWQGAAEALKLPFPQNIAAFAKVLATGISAVNAIKSVTKGGGGPTSSSQAAAIPQAPSQPQTSQRVALTLEGETFGRAQVIRLINEINEAQEDGAIIRVVQ